MCREGDHTFSGGLGKGLVKVPTTENISDALCSRHKEDALACVNVDGLHGELARANVKGDLAVPLGDGVLMLIFRMENIQELTVAEVLVNSPDRIREDELGLLAVDDLPNALVIIGIDANTAKLGVGLAFNACTVTRTHGRITAGGRLGEVATDETGIAVRNTCEATNLFTQHGKDLGEGDTMSDGATVVTHKSARVGVSGQQGVLRVGIFKGAAIVSCETACVYIGGVEGRGLDVHDRHFLADIFVGRAFGIACVDRTRVIAHDTADIQGLFRSVRSAVNEAHGVGVGNGGGVIARDTAKVGVGTCLTHIGDDVAVGAVAVGDGIARVARNTARVDRACGHAVQISEGVITLGDGTVLISRDTAEIQRILICDACVDVTNGIARADGRGASRDAACVSGVLIHKCDGTVSLNVVDRGGGVAHDAANVKVLAIVVVDVNDGVGDRFVNRGVGVTHNTAYIHVVLVGRRAIVTDRAGREITEEVHVTDRTLRFTRDTTRIETTGLLGEVDDGISSAVGNSGDRAADTADKQIFADVKDQATLIISVADKIACITGNTAHISHIGGQIHVARKRTIRNRTVDIAYDTAVVDSILYADGGLLYFKGQARNVTIYVSGRVTEVQGGGVGDVGLCGHRNGAVSFASCVTGQASVIDGKTADGHVGNSRRTLTNVTCSSRNTAVINVACSRDGYGVGGGVDVFDTTVDVACDNTVVDVSVSTDHGLVDFIGNVGHIPFGVANDASVIQGVGVKQRNTAVEDTIVNAYGITGDTADIQSSLSGSLNSARYMNAADGLISGFADIGARIRGAAAETCGRDLYVSCRNVGDVAFGLTGYTTDLEGIGRGNIDQSGDRAIRQETVGVITHDTAHTDLYLLGVDDHEIGVYGHTVQLTEQHTDGTTNVFAANNVDHARQGTTHDLTVQNACQTADVDHLFGGNTVEMIILNGKIHDDCGVVNGTEEADCQIICLGNVHGQSCDLMAVTVDEALEGVAIGQTGITVLSITDGLPIRIAR